MLNFIKKFVSKLLDQNKNPETDEMQKAEPTVRQWQFSDYVPRIPEIVLYMSRQREI